MSSRRPLHPVWLIVVSALFAVVAFLWWVREGRPVDVGVAASNRVQCMSYAPFRKPGESPFVVGTWVDEARLKEDLGILSPRTDCVRTYSVQQGLEAVPKIAQSLNMKVLLGVWLGRNRAENEAELVKAIGLARQYPGTVAALVIGNEVLLRRELAESVIAGYLDRARAEAGVPVTYADVWEFWAQHPDLASHVDFVTVHILPYWEDHPVGIDAAIGHIVETAESMRKLFKGKEILIGETGWPSAGRPRREAVASLVNQARFFRGFSVAAREHGFRYNFIEAFDQPWKRWNEGAMGGNWGLFDSNGKAKFPATGPVAEDPGFRRGLIGAGFGAMVVLGFVAWRRRVAPGAVAGGIGFGFIALLAVLAGAAIGAIAVAQWNYLWVWNRSAAEWLASGFYSLVAVAMPLVALVVVREALDPGVGRLEIPPAVDVLRRWRGVPLGVGGRRLRGRLSAVDVFSLLRVVVLFGTAAMTVLLVFDARYRGFPVALYALPLFALLLVALAGVRMTRLGIEEAALAVVTLACAIAIIPMERLSNTLAWTFALQMVLLAGVATGFRYGRRLQRDRLPSGVNELDRPMSDQVGV